MWGDMFTETWQCLNQKGAKVPDANWLHDKAHDEQLMDSMAGQVRDWAIYIYIYISVYSAFTVVSSACSEESVVISVTRLLYKVPRC